jgi:hypothetical protein
MALSRRAALLLPLLLAACVEAPPPKNYPLLHYDYLTPIRLNVASIDIDQRFIPAGAPADMTAVDPDPPVSALRQMAMDRLQAFGTSGRAVFVIKDASVLRDASGYQGNFAVQLDIYAADNTRAGFAEARVSAHRGYVEGEDPQDALYQLTKQLMDSMNVEFEYQVRRSLKDWIAPPPTSNPPPIQEQLLPPPS